ERWRLLALGALALAGFFLTPFDIRGWMYYLNTRFAHVAAPLFLAAIPPAAARFRRPLLWAAATAALFVAVPLARGFSEFGDEASAIEPLVAASAPKPMVVGLVFNPNSSVVTHPVYL